MAVTNTGLSGGVVNGYRKFAVYDILPVTVRCGKRIRCSGGSYFENTARMYELRAYSDGSIASVLLQYGRLSTEKAPLSVLILQFFHTVKYRYSIPESKRIDQEGPAIRGKS